VDVNGTNLKVMVGERDWTDRLEGETTLAERGLAWDPASQAVTLLPQAFDPPSPPGSRLLEPAQRRGAAPDRFGNWFFVDADRTAVRMTPAGDSHSRAYWPREQPDARTPSDFAPAAPAPPPVAPLLAGLVVTARHYLVVGVPSLPGLRVLDLHGGGPAVTIAWPVPFDPIDMAPAPDGGAWILDRAASRPGHVRLWLLDRHLAVVDLGGAPPPPGCEDEFHPADGAEPQEERWAVGARIDPAMAVEIAVADPLSVEALPDGSVLVLDRRGPAGPSAVLRFRRGERLEFPFPAWGLDALAHDIAFVPAAAAGTVGVAAGGRAADAAGRPSVAGRLLAVDAEGTQATAFLISDDGEEVTATPEFLPMRAFGGKAVGTFGDAAYYDVGDRWLPLIDWQRRRYATDALLVTDPFDGGEPGCVWHRLAIDGCVPTGTEVAVESRAADSLELLAGEAWTSEPGPYRRREGAEIPSYRPVAPGTAGDEADTWELLFQRARGRHLQLRLWLRGNGRQTPRLAALRIHYPRFSYLREYLPDAYQDDEHSAAFLDRYLANLEGIYTSLEGRIETAQALFDVRAVEAEFLPWLASWLGGVLDPEWEEARRRLFVAHAVDLFRQRGTRRGLIRAIRLATDQCPDRGLFTDDGVLEGAGAGEPFGVRIVERFLTRAAPGVVFGDPTEAEGPRRVSPGDRWTPADGAERLDVLWRCFLKGAYDTVVALNAAHGTSLSAFDEAAFPALTPASAAAAADWRRFVRSSLAVSYDDVGPDDRPALEAFLAQRYVRVEALSAAWGLSGAARPASFAGVALPADVPPQATALRDWVQFVSVVLPTARRAHLFTVLVPVRPEDADDEIERRVGRVERVVLAQKPAHTSYEVASYWAAFRVGEARVGLETVVGQGARFTAIVLGRGRLAATFTPGGPPWGVLDRFVVGRDRVAPEGAEGTHTRGSHR
jgi:phage tail-like protein